MVDQLGNDTPRFICDTGCCAHVGSKPYATSRDQKVTLFVKVFEDQTQLGSVMPRDKQMSCRRFIKQTTFPLQLVFPF